MCVRGVVLHTLPNEMQLREVKKAEATQDMQFVGGCSGMTKDTKFSIPKFE